MAIPLLRSATILVAAALIVATTGLAASAAFTTNPAGSAIVNAIGPIRQVVRGEDKMQRRYLVIAPGTAEKHGAPVQVQVQ